MSYISSSAHEKQQSIPQDATKAGEQEKGILRDVPEAGPIGKALGGLIVSSLISASIYGLYHGFDKLDEHRAREHRLNEAAQSQTEIVLQNEEIPRLSLKSGNIVAIPSVKVTDRQLEAAKENVGNFDGLPGGDTHKPYLLDIYKRSRGVSLMPTGIKGMPLVTIPEIGNDIETTSVVNLDITSNDKLGKHDTKVVIAATEPVKDVYAQVSYDDSFNELRLRVFYGENSPTDDFHLLAMITEGNE